MLKPRLRRIAAALLLLASASLPLCAQPAPNEKMPPLFKPTVKRVAVFKNGYVFTYREGEARPEAGWAYTTEVPSGVLGAVWGYTTTPQARITQLLASEADASVSSRVANLAEFLLINEGGRVRVKTDYSEKIFEGTYVILSPQRKFPVGAPAELTREINPVESGTSFDIALTNEAGTTVISAGRVTYVEMAGQPRWEKVVKTKERRLAIKSDGRTDGGSVGLGVAALERGIRWIPAYRLEVKGEPVREAKLELEAMIVNELTDLEGAEVYFVVGVPHFLFRDTLSPLSLNTTFAGVSGYFTISQNLASNAIMTQAARMSERQSDETTYRPGAPSVVPGEDVVPAMSADELFLYRADQINLKRNERASVRLFSLSVPCTELFEWTIPEDGGQTQAASYSSDARSAQDLSRRVWYALKLKNQTGMPWTTAPVLNFRDWKPLGQDMLTFTPVGTETIVRVTPATEVVGSHTLEEKLRARRVLKDSDGYDHDLVTVEGTVKVRNLKSQPVEMRLTRTVVGEVAAPLEHGKVSREGFNLQSLNPRSVVHWEFTLPPGEKQLRYVYKVYVRS